MTKRSVATVMLSSTMKTSSCKEYENREMLFPSAECSGKEGERRRMMFHLKYVPGSVRYLNINTKHYY